MRLHRFYTKENLVVGSVLQLSDPRLIHQWKNVFRFRGGQEVILFNGNGLEFHAVINHVSKDDAEVVIGESKVVFIESRKVTLYMSVIKKDLFELVCEKATELGVSCIVPILTERSLEKNLNIERLEKIVIEASEQCGRGDVPEIKPIIKLESALDKVEGSIVVSEFGGESVSKTSKQYPTSIFIGPEGGWGEKDKEIFSKCNVKYVSLCETVLRAETAGIVTVYEFLK